MCNRLINSLLHLVVIMALVNSRRLPTIHWNSSNAMFNDRARFPPDGEIGSGAAYIEVDPMDTMDIVCPTHNNWDRERPPEKLVVFQVSDLSFMNCELDSRSQVFLVCDKPRSRLPLRHRIVFRPFSPLPNGFEYQPGRSYYLITTSNGSVEGMNNSRRGLCMSHNLRLRIDVRPENDSVIPPLLQPHINPRVDLDPKMVRPGNKPKQRASEDHSPRHVRPQIPSQDTSEDVYSPHIDESVLFAAKHGLDLNRLEYVRQLARDGAEGVFPFQINKPYDTGTQALSHAGGVEQQGRNHGKLQTLEEHRTANSLGGEGGSSSSNHQAQRWISAEDQRRYGGERLLSDGHQPLGKGKGKAVPQDEPRDYRVDENSASDSISSSTRSLFVAALALVLCRRALLRL